MNADIAIGAVEIKDGTTDTRAVVRTDGTENALVVVQNEMNATDWATSLPDPIHSGPYGVTGKTALFTYDYQVADKLNDIDGNQTNGLQKVQIITPLGDSVANDTEDVLLVGVKGTVGYDNPNDLFKNTIYGFDVDGTTPQTYSSILTDWTPLISWTERGMPMVAQDSTFTYWYPLTVDTSQGSLYTIGKDVSGNLQVFTATGEVKVENLTACNTGAVVVSSGAITETNSGAIKTAVELIDNAISGTEMQVDVVAPLPAGTNVIGNVSVTTLKPDGTNTMPSGDTPARGVYAKLTDGATNVGICSGFVVNPMYVYHTDGEGNYTPTGDADARALYVNLGANNDVSINGATTIGEYNTTLTVVNTEYSQALPAGCKAIEFQCREDRDIRYSFTTGKVAASTSPYFTLKAGQTYYKENLSLTSKTIYFATSATAGDVIELITFS